MPTVAVFIDLKKAFDTSNHEIIANNLYHYGIRGVVFEWIVSYLSNGKQFIQVSDISSEHKTTKFLGIYVDQKLTWKRHISDVLCIL